MSDNLSLSQGLTVCLGAAGLAEGTNANTIQTGNTVAYTIDGRFYSKSATDNIAISYTGATVYQAAAGGIQAVNGGFTGGVNGSTRLYLVCLNSAGAVSIVPGKIVDSAALAAGEVSLDFPSAPKGVCPIGAIKVALTAGTTFTPGSTDLGAAGVTDTYYDLADVPVTPLTA